MAKATLQTKIAGVDLRIGLIQSVMDELATLPYCSKQETAQVIEGAMYELKRWCAPGVDSSRAAYHFKCIAFHYLTLIACGAAKFDFMKLVQQNLEWSLTYLEDEREALEGLQEIQEMSN